MKGYFDAEKRELFVPYLFIARYEPETGLNVNFCPKDLAARVLEFRRNAYNIQRRIFAGEIVVLEFNEQPEAYYLENILRFTVSDVNQQVSMLYAENNARHLFNLAEQEAA